MNLDDIRKETERIIYTSDYKPGMIFHENNKYWIGIVKISDKGIVSVLEGEDVSNLSYFNYKKDELRERLTYELFYGTWVNYYDTNNNTVKLWLKSKIQTTYKGTNIDILSTIIK